MRRLDEGAEGRALLKAKAREDDEVSEILLGEVECAAKWDAISRKALKLDNSRVRDSVRSVGFLGKSVLPRNVVLN